MTRAELVQELRRMRFDEAYGGWQERRLTQEAAARLLGVCDRTIRALWDGTRRMALVASLTDA